MQPGLNWISFLTIARKEMKRISRVWVQAIVPPFIRGVLYFTIFGQIIGSQLKKINGVSYGDFIVPGVVMIAVILNAYANTGTSVFSAKVNRSIEEILVSPTRYTTIILGFAFGGVFRGLLTGIVVLLTAACFKPVHIENWFAFCYFFIGTALCFSLLGFANGVFSKKTSEKSAGSQFILRPLTYLGGVFYSINVLPQHFQTLVQFNPILYMVNGLRYGFLGVCDINIMTAAMLLLVLNMVLFLTNILLLKHKYGSC